MNHHPNPVAADSQCGVILSKLKRHYRCWVPMPLLAKLARCYTVHSRIADLRRRGFNIECRVKRKEGRVCESSYRLQRAAQ